MHLQRLLWFVVLLACNLACCTHIEVRDETNLEGRSLECLVINVVADELKKIGSKATSFCSSFLSIPLATSVVTSVSRKCSSNAEDLTSSRASFPLQMLLPKPVLSLPPLYMRKFLPFFLRPLLRVGKHNYICDTRNRDDDTNDIQSSGYDPPC